MQISAELWDKLVKYNKIQDWYLTMYGQEWYFIKKSKKPGYAWFKHTDTDKVIEWKVSDISDIGGMDIAKFLEASNVSPNGNLTYLEINEPTDFHKDIQGKREYSYNDIEFNNEMTVVFHKDVSVDIRNRTVKITGVGTDTGIQLKNTKGRPRFTREI